MMADTVMALGALQLPQTSGPVPLKDLKYEGRREQSDMGLMASFFLFLNQVRQD